MIKSEIKMKLKKVKKGKLNKNWSKKKQNEFQLLVKF